MDSDRAHPRRGPPETGHSYRSPSGKDILSTVRRHRWQVKRTESPSAGGEDLMAYSSKERLSVISVV